MKFLKISELNNEKQVLNNIFINCQNIVSISAKEDLFSNINQKDDYIFNQYICDIDDLDLKELKPSSEKYNEYEHDNYIHDLQIIVTDNIYNKEYNFPLAKLTIKEI